MRSLRPTPLLKYSGPSEPPYRKPDSLPQKLILKSSNTRNDGSISMLDSAADLTEGNAGLKTISPALRIDAGTVTITLSASTVKGSVDTAVNTVSPLIIILDPV